SISGALQQIETETRAALEQTQQGIQRLLDLAADGVIERGELSSKLQELCEKKERLTRDLQAFNESKAIKAEILEAMEFLKGDLEQVLWDLLEKNPQILARILRLIFKPHSVVVEAYYDKTVKGRSFVPGKRKGRVVDYELNEYFLTLRVYNNRRADGCPIVEPFGFVGWEIHAAVTHSMTKIVMPICAVNGVALIKEHCPGDIRQIVIVNAGRAASHSHGGIFAQDFERADDGWVVCGSGGNINRFQRIRTFVRRNGLICKVDINPLAVGRRIRNN